jgi:hypothetical protein
MGLSGEQAGGDAPDEGPQECMRARPDVRLSSVNASGNIVYLLRRRADRAATATSRSARISSLSNIAGAARTATRVGCHDATAVITASTAATVVRFHESVTVTS